MELSTASAYANEVAWLRERCLQLNSSNKDNTAENGHIRFEPEFRFMLARHWTLFNGMLHSRFMATRLAVWRDRGKRMLETFIVKMGIPLAQCKLDFSSMEVEIKDSLPFRIARHAAEFGLEDIQFPSFLRNFGFVMKLSASDAVYALMALIETPSDGGGKTRDSWVSSFFSALEALNPSHVTKFKLGIKMAMRQQQTILNEASNILSHKLIRYGRRFRHVVLRNSTDLPWLTTHPQTLTKLALFLAEATMTAPNGRTPLLLAAYQPTHDTYLVVSTNTPNAKDSIAPHK